MRASEFITEHQMVWKRSPSGKVSLKWRCMSGPRAGRTVPKPSDCGKAPNVAQAARMKTTRARTKTRAAKRAKKTKRINPQSRLVQKLNRAMRKR